MLLNMTIATKFPHTSIKVPLVRDRDYDYSCTYCFETGHDKYDCSILYSDKLKQYWLTFYNKLLSKKYFVDIQIEGYETRFNIYTNKIKIKDILSLISTNIKPDYGFKLEEYVWYQLHNGSHKYKEEQWEFISGDYIYSSNTYAMELPCIACECGLDDYHNHPVLLV